MTKNDKNTVKTPPPPPPAPTKRAADTSHQAAQNQSQNKENGFDFTSIIPPYSTPEQIGDYFSQTPAPLDFLWEGGPLLGSVGALVSPGGVGKSWFALQAAAAIAAGTEDADLLGIKPTKRGVVHYFSFEDSEAIFWHRLHDLAAHFSPDTREKIKENLRIHYMMQAQGFDLALEGIEHAIIPAITGARLVIIDTLNQSHTFDENRNDEMSQLLRRIRHIADASKATILFIHHTNKASAFTGQGDVQQAARGASAIVDNSRWIGYVQNMSSDEAKECFEPHEIEPVGEDFKWRFIKHGTSKINYGNAIENLWLERIENGILKRVDLEQISQANQRENLKGNSSKKAQKNNYKSQGRNRDVAAF